MTGGPATERDPDAPAGSDDSTPAEAFQQLGSELRVTIIRQLASEGPCSFSTLSERSESDTSAGFAYHLRQLADQFVRQREDERWELTTAGQEAAQTITSGSFTESIDHEMIALEESCPLCHEQDLSLSVSDSVAEVSCSACTTSVMRLSCPPSGYGHDDENLPAALDSYHRHRLGAFLDGVCPDCGGRVETSPKAVPPAAQESVQGESTRDESGDDSPDQNPTVAQLESVCTRCTASFDCPVTLAVLDEPAVVSFYGDHDRDITDRPVWNVGSEWCERVLSTDPWCLLVSTQLGDERLELYVGEDGTVHEHRHRPVQESANTTSATERSAESGEVGDDAAA